MKALKEKVIGIIKGFVILRNMPLLQVNITILEQLRRNSKIFLEIITIIVLINYIKDGQDHVIECDTVIIAAGSSLNNELENELEGKIENLTVIGDAEAPRKILTAIHEGYHTIRVRFIIIKLKETI